MDPNRWFCNSCGTIRTTTPCWKCKGTDGHAVVADYPDLALPDITRIRELAKDKGYAIGVHGSLEADLDLIAAPWTADAVDPQVLVEYIAANLMTPNGPSRVIDRSRKPHGRMAFNIQLDGWFKLIDISVLPPHV